MSVVRSVSYEGHIKRRGHSDEPGVGEPVYSARRWKVERSISWLNNMRKLRVRWEKKAETYRGLWLLSRRAPHLLPDNFGIDFKWADQSM